jgi:MFS family permease
VFGSFFILNETYAPVLLEQKAARIRKETGNDKYRSKLQEKGTQKDIFLRAIVRPARMFIFSPIVTMMCTYTAVLYGLLYILFTTFTFVYSQVYGFSARGAGLSFIAAGVGNFLGLGLVGGLSDRLIQAKKAAGGEIRPEDRLPLIITIPSATLLPVGLIMYGWTADKAVHWIAPMIGTGLIGFGMIAILMCVQTYLVDSFPLHAASVTAANAVFRSLLGALLPLCGLQMYDKLGLGWGNTLLGFLALALAPVLWLMGSYGERIRTNPRFQIEL